MNDAPVFVEFDVVVDPEAEGHTLSSVRPATTTVENIEKDAKTPF